MQSKIYWQKQGPDRLCGVHCINTLLQGPFFNEVSLAQIAQQLDKSQHALMLEQGMTKDFLKFMGEDSGNVAMDGYYSLQVLEGALRSLNLVMINIDVFKSGEDLITKSGFICNSSDHWFSLRKINNVWYNLNSTNKRLPQIVSDFYLSAFVVAVKNSGYQVFSIEGSYPQSSPDRFDYYNKNQMWINKRRIDSYHQKCIKRKGFKPNISGAGADEEMEKAIALSMGKSYKKYVSSGQDEDWQENQPKKKELKQFGGIGANMGDNVYVDYQKFRFHENDMDMVEIIRQSLAEQFSIEQKDGILVTIRHPSGLKEQKIFPKLALIETLYDYVWYKRSIKSKFYLTNLENKQNLVDVSIPLFALQDSEGSIIVIVNDQ